MPEYNDLPPLEPGPCGEMLPWQRDVWHIPEFFELLTQQQEEFDKAITGQKSPPGRRWTTVATFQHVHPARCRPHRVTA